jgi:hypothetical protein
MAQPQGQEQAPQPIYLFISQSCQYCRELIQEMQKKPELAKRVQAVSIENTPKLPPGLTRVPGILHEGKITMGTDCFEFVEKFGELGTSPVFSGNGFEADGYSFLDESNGGGGETGSDNFSFIGADNGSAGIDTSQVDQSNKQEQGQRKESVNMDSITQQRQQEMGKMGIGGGPGQGGPSPGGGPQSQRIY